jgi:hypothetical protein
MSISNTNVCQRCGMTTNMGAHECEAKQNVDITYAKPNPYRCPNCNGWGERASWPEQLGATTAGGLVKVECPSCQGTGVLWR